MGLQATHPGLAQVRPSESWLVRHRAVIIRHAVINFFLLTILLPLPGCCCCRSSRCRIR